MCIVLVKLAVLNTLSNTDNCAVICIIPQEHLHMHKLSWQNMSIMRHLGCCAVAPVAAAAEVPQRKDFAPSLEAANDSYVIDG